MSNGTRWKSAGDRSSEASSPGVPGHERAARGRTELDSALHTLHRAGRIQLVTSPYCMEEALRNVDPSAPAADRLDELLAEIPLVPDGVSALSWAKRHVSKSKDVPVLASAAAAGIEYLATLDVAEFGKVFGRPDLPVHEERPGALLRLLPTR